MSKLGSPQFSEDEKRFLHYETLITNAIEARERPDSRLPRPIWFQVLESKAVTTLITIIIGGIVGQIIIASIQDNLKRNNQSLTEYKQYLERQQDIVQHAYDLVGKCTFDAQNLISLTQPNFEIKNISEEEKDPVRKQKQDVLARHNSVIEEWQRDKNKIGLLISYYHYGQPDVLPAWRMAQSAVDELLMCGLREYKDYSSNPDSTKDRSNSCYAEKEKVHSKLDKLAVILENSRRYIWQEQTIPPRTPGT